MAAIKTQILPLAENAGENFCLIESVNIREFAKLKGCKYINLKN
jgi:hypothetical protein